jgi:hypothetical protein
MSPYRKSQRCAAPMEYREQTSAPSTQEGLRSDVAASPKRLSKSAGCCPGWCC